MEISLQTSLAQFQAAFNAYLDYTRKTPDEALERKAKNVGIRVWRIFSEHEFGGSPRQSGIAERELEQRTAAGKGTKVRASLLEKYAEARGALLSERKALRKQKRGFGGTLDQHTALTAALQENANKRFSLWQDTVGLETKKRQQGIGYLGASFLAVRKRKLGASGVTFVTNKTGKGIGYVLKQPEFLRIASLADGSGLINERYGVIAKAISDEAADTARWIYEKDQENLAKAGLTR